MGFTMCSLETQIDEFSGDSYKNVHDSRNEPLE